MDLAYIIYKLFPNDKYEGVANSFTEEQYNLIKWDNKKEKPTWETIQNNKTKYENLLKLIKLRSIRDQILNNTDWITSRIGKEELAVSLGLITREQTKWSNMELTQYLMWCKYMLELPDTIDINNIKDEDLTIDNKLLFIDCPINTKLTKIEGE